MQKTRSPFPWDPWSWHIFTYMNGWFFMVHVGEEKPWPWIRHGFWKHFFVFRQICFGHLIIHPSFTCQLCHKTVLEPVSGMPRLRLPIHLPEVSQFAPWKNDGRKTWKGKLFKGELSNFGVVNAWNKGVYYVYNRIYSFESIILIHELSFLRRLPLSHHLDIKHPILLTDLKGGKWSGSGFRLKTLSYRFHVLNSSWWCQLIWQKISVKLSNA